MPSVKNLTLTYDALNGAGTFSEGDLLTGKVTLFLEKETKVSGLFAKVKGDAKVSWTEGGGDNNTGHSAHRRYFKFKQYLIQQDIVLPRGIHRFNFRFKIPMSSMPSSFKGTNGEIVYMLEAKMSRSWRKDCEVQTELNFVSKSMPNIDQGPQVGSVDKELGLFSTGLVQMIAKIDREAFASGETVTVLAKIKNSSSKKVTPKFILNQKVVYYSKGSTTSSKKTVCGMMAEAIAPKIQKTVSCPMKIPFDQVPTIHNCDILSVEYYLKVYLDISFAFDPEIRFPLVILPPGFTSDLQPVGAVGPIPPGACGGPSNSDFPPCLIPDVPYLVPSAPGTYGYAAAPDPAKQADMKGSYNSKLPQPAFSHGQPLPVFPSPSVNNQARSAPPVDQQEEEPPSYASIFPVSEKPHTAPEK